MKTYKRILSILMVIALSVGFLPVGVSAWEDEPLQILSWDYSGTNIYILGRDEEVHFEIEIGNNLTEWERLILCLEPFDAPVGGHYEPITFDLWPQGNGVHTAYINITERSKEYEEWHGKGIEPGEYELLVGVVNYESWEEPEFTHLGFRIEISEPEPILEKPEVREVTVPQNIQAGRDNSIRITGELVFEDNYAIDGRYVKLQLSKYDSNKATKTAINSDIVRLEHKTYKDDYIYFSGEIKSPHPHISLNYSGFEAGDYVVELVPNYDTEHEDQNVTLLTEFTIEGPRLSPITLYVDTDKGVAEAGASGVGNEDVVTLRFENWDDNYTWNSLYIMPADVVMGSYGWSLKPYQMTQLDKSGVIRNGDGKATFPGIVMTSTPKGIIPPGEYVFYETWSYTVSEPFTIFEGKSSVESTLTGIEIKTQPYQTTYMDGDGLDLSGLEVWANYDNASGRLVRDYTVYPEVGMPLTAGENTVTVTYTEGGKTVSTSFDVTVLDSGGFKEISLSSASNGIVIKPGSGNYVIKGECFFNNPYLEYEDFLITVASGYEGIIRLDGAEFLGADYENMFPILHEERMKPILVEGGASVIFDLVGENLLIGSKATGITVSEGAEVSITSSSGGKLNVFGGVYGAAIGGDYGGTIKINGNAEVNASANSGPGIGGYGKYGSNTESDAVVIISGNAIVNAESTMSAGIGGAQSRAGGTIIIKGNARVNAKSRYSAGIGGGYGEHTGGDGGDITIGENAIVNAESGIPGDSDMGGSAGIGGGRGGYNGHGGFGGNVTIEGNATVNAVSHGLDATGIGGGPNYQTRGSRGINLSITGGTVSTASTYNNNGYDLGGYNSPNYVKIEGGSVYPAYQKVSGTQTISGVPTYLVKLTAEDGEGNPLDGKRLNIGGYEALTGKNPVWDAAEKKFTSDLQQGVAYLWLPEGEYTINGGNPGTITVDRRDTLPREFTIVFGDDIDETPELVGNVTIEGEAKFGETLTANTDAITVSAGELGALFYQWKRDGAAIPGANSSTYAITADDMGKAITVTVTAAGCLGEITSDAENVASKAESVTVTGQDGKSSITTKGGTLQMQAEISPADAAQAVTWSVAEGGSYGKISATGLLTATADGTVTVRATAKDGAGVYGEMTVKISGQGKPNTGSPGGAPPATGDPVPESPAPDPEAPVPSAPIPEDINDPDTPLSPGTPVFDDVEETDWYYAAVVYAVQNGIMKGTGDGEFEPESVLTRAMMAQLLCNYDGGAPTKKGIFDDAKDGEWYDDAVNWAAENKIVSGVGNSLFAPGAEITREQMAVMLYNYCIYKGIELPVVNEDSSFADSGDISGWARKAVEAMHKAGIINGKGGGFDPRGTATRGEAAQMFMNFMEVIKKLDEKN